MSDLELIINSLEHLIKINSSNIKEINYPRKLVTSLKKLKNMIGMNSVKDSIAKQVTFLIEQKTSKFDCMLHTVIYGPPGTGKTTIGLLLSEIWENIGIVKKKNKNKNFVTVSRSDFVAEYLGQTSIKTLDLLNNNLGKVLFIDEAYSLINGKEDCYGMEAITTLNQFMTEHSSEIIIIIAGYKDMLHDTIFKHQPGLERRCVWIHEIENYTGEELYEILKYQNKNYILPDLTEFFKTNVKEFKFFGGDTQRLLFYAKLEHSMNIFKNNKDIRDKNISLEDIQKAFDYLMKNRISCVKEELCSHCENIEKEKSCKKCKEEINLFKKIKHNMYS